MDTLTKLAESLAANPWLILVGVLLSVLGLIGIPLSIVLYYKARKDRLPRYSVKTNVIIEGHKEKYPALSVHFDGYGDDLPNLSVSRIAFWNAGKETIRKDDVVKKAITLQCKEGCRILDITIVHVATEANRFMVTRSQDRTSATITFDYFDFNQGVVFQVFHTGTSSSELSLLGIVMGAGEPERRATLIPHSRSHRRHRLLVPYAWINLLVGIGASVLELTGVTENSLPTGGILVAMALVFLVFYYWLLRTWRVPNSLRESFEDDK